MDAPSLQKAIKYYLAEDIGTGDITSEIVFAPGQTGEAVLVAKDSFVVAGMESVAAPVFRTQNPAVRCLSCVADGTLTNAGDVLMTVQGPVLDLLKAERVALNLVQRLCGIATLTAEFVARVKDLPVRIVDTRKTTPGLRVLEKYAVRTGGGHNHRFSLADGILLKDNHIAACGSIREAVERIRQQAPHTLKIEVEVESFDQIQECLDCGVDIIMLDNMDTSLMRQAVSLINNKALVEASGGINQDNVRDIAETGVDIISIGALTHSAPARDISMRLTSAG